MVRQVVSIACLAVFARWYLLRFTGVCWDPILPCRSNDSISIGDVVLITGSSSGVGKALAFEYARRGAKLVITARREPLLQDVAKTCRSLGAESVLVIPGDVRQIGAQLVAATKERFGKLDLLVLNHAWIEMRLFSEDDNEMSHAEAVMQTNYIASARLTKLAMPLLRTAGRRGRIAAVGTCGTFFFPAFYSAYTASKSAISSFLSTLRVELELSDDVRTPSITLLHLGEIATEHHLETTGVAKDDIVAISPASCATGIAVAVDRRLNEAYIPKFMWAASWLGSFAPLRSPFFRFGFLTARPALATRLRSGAGSADPYGNKA